jgi:hypothetical protein
VPLSPRHALLFPFRLANQIKDEFSDWQILGGDV